MPGNRMDLTGKVMEKIENFETEDRRLEDVREDE
jgi:hypothetical protein